MELLLELEDAQKSFCVDDVIPNLIASIQEGIELIEYDNENEQHLLSKINTLSVCMQFSHQQKKSFDKEILELFFEPLILFYFNTKNFLHDFEMMHSLCNLIVQCVQLLCSSPTTSMHCMNVFSVNICTLFVHRGVCSHGVSLPSDCSFVSENQVQFQVKKVKHLLGLSALFPAHLVIELISKLTDHICAFSTYNVHFSDCLSLLDAVLTKANTTNDIAKAAFTSICYLTDHISSSLGHCVHYWHLVSPECSEVSMRENVPNKIACCICLLDTAINYVSTKGSSSVQDFSFILRKAEMWSGLQMGTYHNLKVIRKKTSNVLKNVVSYIEKHKSNFTIPWSKRDQSLPDNETRQLADQILISFNSINLSASLSMLIKYIQICELLEEDQTHVVAPATTKVKAFILASTSESEDCPYSSWILPILLRMFFHDNKTIQRDGLVLCLNTNFASCLMKQCTWLPFISYGLMELISRDYIYYCDDIDDSAEEVNIRVELCHFMNACHHSSQSSVKFLKGLLLAICDSTWSSISLFNVCEALYQLPCTNAWDCKDYQLLRKLFIEIVETHNITLRIATQQKLVGCLMHHCCLPNFDLFDFMALLVESVKSKALVYGNSTWKEVSNWLTDSILLMKHGFGRIDNVAQLMRCWVEKCLNNDCDPMIVQCAVIAFCLLMYGASSNEVANTSLIEELTHSVMNLINTTINKAVTYLYMCENRIECVFMFVEQLFQLKNNSSSQEKEPDYFVALSLKTFEGIIEYFSCKPFTLLVDIFVAKTHLSAAKELIKFVFGKISQQPKAKMHDLLRSAIHNIIKCVTTGSEKQNKSENSMVIYSIVFHWCLEHIHDYAIKLDSPTYLECAGIISSLQLAWSDIPVQIFTNKENLSTLIECNWLCVPYAFDFNSSGKVLASFEKIMELFVDQLDAVSINSLVTFFAVSKLIFAQVLTEDHRDLCALCVNKMVKLTFELSHSSVFRPLYHHFVDAVFQPSILCAVPDSAMRNTLDDAFAKIIEHSQSKLGLLEQVLKCCGHYWMSLDSHNINKHGDISMTTLEKLISSPKPFDEDKIASTNLKSALNSLEFFLHCLTYNSPSTKAIKSINQIVKNANLSGGTSSDSGHIVSLRASSSLLSLDISNPEHLLFADQLFDELIQMNKAISDEKPRFHFASSTHFKKQKIWQNIIILVPLLPASKSENIVNTFVSCLAEDMQISVRHLIEWSLVLLLYRFPVHEEMVLEKLRKNVSAGFSYSAICSYLTVALLCGLTRLYREGPEGQKTYFMNIVKLLVPWCMSQQFTIRLYAHAVLLRIFQYFTSSGEEDVLNDAFPWLASSLDFADHSSGNVKKNWIKIRQHFILFQFDPIAEFSAESVFIALPRLCHLDVPTFKELKKELTCKWLPLRSLKDTMRNIKESSWVTPGGKQKSFILERKSDDHIDQKEWNMQRKIVVSKDTKASHKSGVILVASLLSKMSNLGGLTRTCEVFGAERLVVASFNCMSDPLYQSLSVTAHKWLPMQEVKSHKLAEYLSGLKKDGYVIIGAEQTEKSQCLSQFKFPVKSAVVLGNEKEGIPHSLLSLLDICIEIPQLGVIRSLNVHVSGAIVLWEYRKQHITQS